MKFQIDSIRFPGLTFDMAAIIEYDERGLPK